MSLPLERLRYLSPSEFGSTFRSGWDRCSQRFFKCERLQHYTEHGEPSDEALRAGRFLEAVYLVQLRVEAQEEMYRELRSRGARSVRVRVIERPLSRYLKYELLSYLSGLRIGEDVRIVEADAIGRSTAADAIDFVMFDDSLALIHDYRPPENAFHGGWVVDDPNLLGDLSRTADELERIAVPILESNLDL